jgi:NDP-sugar pyrophosphorylase family protein
MKQGMIFAIVGVTIAVLILAVVFQIAPMVGSEIESASNIPGQTYAIATLTFTDIVQDGELVNISDEVYEFDTNLTASEIGAGHIEVDIADTTIPTAVVNLTSVINANSAYVTASNTSDAVIAQAKTIGSAGNSITVSDTVANASWDASNLHGGSDGSEWNATINTNIKTGVDVWEKTGIIAVAIVIVVIAMILSVLMGVGGSFRYR